MSLLPTKHISMHISAIGIGAAILSVMEDGMDYNMLTDRLNEFYAHKLNDGPPLPSITPALDLLELLGAIELRDGRMYFAVR